MKRILNKRISIDVKTMLTMLLVGILFVSVISATPAFASQIQATIASHFTVRYNGEVQHMRDANGNTVHPLVFNGITYLPLRATADMFGVPVNWIGETNTIELGSAGGATTGAAQPVTPGVRLREVSRIQNASHASAEWINDPNIFPRNNTRSYSDAIRFPTHGRGRLASLSTSIRWEGSYSHISFDVAATGNGGVTVRLARNPGFMFDYIWEQDLVPGEVLSVSDLDISDFGRTPLWVSVFSANGEDSYAWILDPALR